LISGSWSKGELSAQERRKIMTSGGMPMRPGLDAIYEALRRAIRDDPQLLERKAEEVSKELVRGGYLHDEPAAALMAEIIRDLEVEEQRPQPQGPRPDGPSEE
jgi:hypothetical protein